MSLYEPLPQADLAPNLPSTDALTWREWEDYGHLFVWVFWRPHSLTHYLRESHKHGKNLAAKRGRPEVAQEFYGRVLDRLYQLVFALTLLLVAFVCLGYWAVISIVRLINNWPIQPLSTLFPGLVAGLFVVGLTYLIIRGINDWALIPIKRTDMAIAAILILGSVWGITAGIYFLDSYTGDFLFRVALMSASVGTTIGLVVSTLTYYIKKESEQRSFIFSYLLFLFFILGATIFGGLLTRSFAFMWISLLCMGTSFLFAALRIDDWLLGQILKGTALAERDARKLPRVTAIPIIGLRLELEDWLDWDWNGALKNIKTIREYTRQDSMTSLAIRQILKEASNDKDKGIVSKVEQLQSVFANTDLRHFSPSSLSDNITRNVGQQMLLQIMRPSEQREPRNKNRQQERKRHRQSRRLREQHRGQLTGTYPSELLADAAIAGYSYLRLNHPDRAIKAFEKVDHDDLGKEMVEVSKAVDLLWHAEKLPEKAPLELPSKPENSKHDDTWMALTRFRDIVRYVWLLRRTRTRQSYDIVKTLIEEKLSDLKLNLPTTVEGTALGLIADDWDAETKNLFDTFENTDKVKSIDDNPFVFADPLNSGSKGLLRGRKEQLALIKAAWKVGNFQPLLIYGQSHMGKTSLIRCADAQFSKDVRTAYVNLRQLPSQATRTDLFLTICDAVAELRIHPVPTRAQIVAAPEREFRQYIHECAARYGSIGLVIVLDELEYLTANAEPPLSTVESSQELIEQSQSIRKPSILLQSIQQLWTLSQLDPNLGMIFITTRNPAELMNDNDQNLLTSSVQPIEVGYLSQDDVAGLLRNPNPKFLPYCTDEATERIFFWTAGQPYLTQLLAYYLVEHYNAQVSSLDGMRDPLFSVVDVDATVQRTDFRRQCEGYFREILMEAVATDGAAVDILEALSEKRMGLTASALNQSLAESVSDYVLAQLKEHQIIRKNNDRWQIIVELFRWWLRERVGLNP